jgi:hypothetical protein
VDGNAIQRARIGQHHPLVPDRGRSAEPVDRAYWARSGISYRSVEQESIVKEWQGNVIILLLWLILFVLMLAASGSIPD